MTYFQVWLCLFHWVSVSYTLCLTDISQEKFEQHKMWLKHSSDPWTKVLELWTKTHAGRKQQIRKNGNQSVSQIFRDWPRYKDEHGYTLVSLLTTNQPTSSSLDWLTYSVSSNTCVMLCCYFSNIQIYRSKETSSFFAGEHDVWKMASASTKSYCSCATDS